MRVIIFGLLSLQLLTVVALSAPPTQEFYGDSVCLEDYVQLLKDMAAFMNHLQAKDFENAQALGQEVSARLPAISSGHEMLFLVGAMSENLALAKESLQTLVDKYFIYPDTYTNFFPLLDQIHDETTRSGMNDAIEEFFQRREAFLKSKLAVGINRKMILVELAYLNHATEDEADTLPLLDEIATFDPALVKTFANTPLWAENLRMHGLVDQVRAAWSRWSGTPEEKMRGFVAVVSKMESMSAALAFSPICDWSAHAAGYIPRVLATKTKQEYYEILAEMVHQAGDNHTSLRFPRDIELAYTDCGLETIFADGRFLVRAVTGSTLAGQAKPGDEILNIDGLPVKKYIDQHRTKYPFVSAAFFKPESYASYWIGERLLSGRRGTRVKLVMRRPDASTYILTADRPLQPPARVPETAEPPAVEVSVRPDRICLITLSQFTGSDAYAQFKKLIAPLDTAAFKGVVIDLRENRGGNSGVGDAIFAHFVEAAVRNYQFDYTPVLIPQKIAAYSGYLRVYREGSLIQPAMDKPIRCPVCVLTSPRTGSAAEDFAFLFRHHQRGQLVGQTTSGATGNGLPVSLPASGELRVNLNVNLYFGGIGLTPDHPVDFTPADLVSGRDPQMAKALQLLGAD